MVLADHAGVVDVFGRAKAEERVVMDIIIKFFGAHAEAGGNLAPINGLHGTCYRTRFDQGNYGIGNHLRMKADIFPLGQELHNHLGNTPIAGNSPYAQLYGGTIWDKGGG